MKSSLSEYQAAPIQHAKEEKKSLKRILIEVLKTRQYKQKLHKRVKYKLWTFQSLDAIHELKRNGILEANSDGYNQTSFFTWSYQWMIQQMTARKIKCRPDHFPIWAWHSCKRYGKAPRLADARCLLSDMQIEAGIQTVAFECPAEIVLLSNYGLWNKVMEQFVSATDGVNINRKTQKKLFSTGRKKFRQYDSIQAAIPYLKLNWVKDIRDLNLTPGDFSFNPEECV